MSHSTVSRFAWLLRRTEELGFMPRAKIALAPLEPQASAPVHDLPRAAKLVLGLLARLEHGVLELALPDGRQLRFGQGDAAPVRLRLHDWEVFAAVLARGDIGLGEAYREGRWSSPDLAGLLALCLRNREALDAVIRGSWWGALLYRARHLLNRNTRSGSRRNIHAHYDLGNAFYARWLDSTMNYSSAWFQGDLAGDLVQAQHAKIRRALSEAGMLAPADRPAAAAPRRVLEIGCGWGALAEGAAREAGVHLTGVTLSTEQLAWAQARLQNAGLAGQVDLRLQDYRDIGDQPFDAVLSIEMFEAVGRDYWPSYFETVARCLKPGGRACIQTITIRDDLFEDYARSTDFIQQYIFPGGLLPSEREFCRSAQQAGLVVERSFAFGADYAETLRRWREQFLAQAEAVRQQGFDEVFMRTWEFYLAYCEAAFDTGNTNVVQFTLRKPQA